MTPSTYPPPHLLDGARWADLRVGLLGGSFNPPHEGHIHVSLTALHMLKLDFVWWLVTPQNPFKDSDGMLPCIDRLALCHNFIKHPQLIATGIENEIGSTRSYDTLRTFKSFFPQTHFVWVTGMDIAHQFHLWYRWQDILKLTATAHAARPPFQELVKDCPLRSLKSQNHHILSHAERVPLVPGSSYWILENHMLDISSTRIREDAETVISQP